MQKRPGKVGEVFVTAEEKGREKGESSEKWGD